MQTLVGHPATVQKAHVDCVHNFIYGSSRV